MQQQTQCSRCGRPLSNAKSREKGIGPECERKLLEGPKKARRANRNPGDNDTIVRYDGGSFFIERKSAPTLKVSHGHLALAPAQHEASGIRTNVPRLVYKHSPTGFNFGYSGSGPADLALNLLLFVCRNTRDAERLYQSFKAHFIAPCQENRLVIDRADLDAWLLFNGAPVKI